MLSGVATAGMLTGGAKRAVLFLCSIVMTLLRFCEKCGEMRHHGVPIFKSNHKFVFPEPPSHPLAFLVCVFFHFATHYFCLTPLLGFRTYYVLSLFSSLSFFPLELSLHTIANNPAKVSHLCSWAFSINPHFSPFFKKK